MIKALLLIFRPVQTWGGIDAANRSIAYVLCLHLLPLILLTSIAEGYGLTHWGRLAPDLRQDVNFREAIALETVQTLVYVGWPSAAYAAKPMPPPSSPLHFSVRRSPFGLGLAPMLVPVR